MATRGELQAQKQREYSQKLTTVKEYAIGFTKKKGYDVADYTKMSKYQRSKVNKYFSAIQEFTSRPNQLYKTRDKSKLEKVKRAVHGHVLKDMKVAFIPNDGEHTATVTVIDNSVKVHYAHVTAEYLPIAARDLAQNTEQAVFNAMALVPDLHYFRICAGNAYVSMESRNTILEEVNRLMMKYNQEKYDKHDIRSKWYGNWMHGLIAYDPTNKASHDDMIDFMKKRRMAQDELTAYKRKLKNADKYRKKKDKERDMRTDRGH